MSDYTEHLLPYLTPEQISIFSCGHVMPRENLLVVPIIYGPKGSPLEYKFSTRGNDVMV